MMNFVASEDGQGMVEYALILALISVVAIAVLTAVGKKVQYRLGEVDKALGDANGDYDPANTHVTTVGTDDTSD